MRKIQYISVAVLLIIAKISYSQINTGGNPYAFNTKKTAANNLQITTLPLTVSMSQIEKEDQDDKQTHNLHRYGIAMEYHFNLNNSGQWTTLPNGDRVWELEIYCPDAKSIDLSYDKFWLPSGAKFYIYNPDTKNFIGGFTEQNNKGTEFDLKGFATGLVHGDKIILEYYEPVCVKNRGVISISRVIYGYRNISASGGQPAINANCQVGINQSPEGDNWQVEKKGVGFLLHDGWSGSFSLIANTSNDRTPYVLTADHCIMDNVNNIKYDAIDRPNIYSWHFIWGYENEGGGQFVTTVGAVVVANMIDTKPYDIGSPDFALLRLIENPVNIPNLEITFNGWDRRPPTKSGVGIHHPGSTTKKIATYDMIPYAYRSYAWLVRWIPTLNGHGIPERGSSGSPLFNREHLIIGHSARINENLWCDNPYGDTFYGRFDYSWNASSDPRRRLKDWLDPINSNVMFFGETCRQFLDNATHTSNTNVHSTCNLEVNNLKVTNGLTSLKGKTVIIQNGFEMQSGSSLEVSSN